MKKWLVLIMLPLVLTGCQAAKERDSLKLTLEQKEQMLLQYQGANSEKDQRIATLEQELKDLSAQLPKEWNEEAVLKATTLKELLDLHSTNLLGVKSPTYYGKLLEVCKLDSSAFILALKNREGEAIQDLIHQMFLNAEAVMPEKDALKLYGEVYQYESLSLKEEFIQNLMEASLLALLSNKGITQADLSVSKERVAYNGSYYIHKLTLDMTLPELTDILGTESSRKEDALTQTVLLMYTVGASADYELDYSLDGADIIGLKNGDITCQAFVWFRAGIIDEIQLYYMEGQEQKSYTLSR